MPESRKTDRDDVLLEDNVSGESEDGKEILMLTKIVINDGNGHANQYIDGNCVKTNKKPDEGDIISEVCWAVPWVDVLRLEKAKITIIVIMIIMMMMMMIIIIMKMITSILKSS